MGESSSGEAETSQEANTFFIERVEVDVVYGDVKELTCNVEHTFSVKTSLTYLADETAHVRQGLPGVTYGYPIPVAFFCTQNEDGSDITDGWYLPSESEKPGQFKVPVPGFRIRGADQNGMCYKVR